MLGAGGHAKVLLNTLQKLDREIIGLTALELGSAVLGVSILGNDDIIENYDPQEIELVNGIGSLPGSTRRFDIYYSFKQKGYQFATVIDPSAIIPNAITVEAGVQIMAGVVLQPDVSVGENTIINTRASIDHDCRIGNHCHIAPGVVLSGGVKVDNYVHIGTGAVVIQDIQIGAWAIVAAGATVYKNMVIKQKYIPANEELA